MYVCMYVCSAVRRARFQSVRTGRSRQQRRPGGKRSQACMYVCRQASRTFCPLCRGVRKLLFTNMAGNGSVSPSLAAFSRGARAGGKFSQPDRLGPKGRASVSWLQHEQREGGGLTKRSGAELQRRWTVGCFGCWPGKGASLDRSATLYLMCIPIYMYVCTCACMYVCVCMPATAHGRRRVGMVVISDCASSA